MGKGKDAQKYKLTLSIDSDFARRFAAFAGFLGQDQSEIATRAIRREMRGFSISHRVGDDGQADAPEGTAVRLARPDGGREAG
jgi:hypothetical protein